MAGQQLLAESAVPAICGTVVEYNPGCRHRLWLIDAETGRGETLKPMESQFHLVHFIFHDP